MGIRTKFNPMGGLAGGKTYKAYLLLQKNYIDVADLGFTEKIDPDKTFGFENKDGIFGGTYIILNGKLFFVTYSGPTVSSFSISQVGTSDTWSVASGNGYASYCYGFGINNGSLYRLRTTTAESIASITGWTNITGGVYTQDSARSRTYGIANNKLYAITTSSATQIGSLTDWTSVKGDEGKALGICSGKLYYINGTSVTQIGSYTNWKKTTDYSSAISPGKALGIRGQTLYGITYNSASQIDSSSSYSVITGYYAGNINAYAITSDNVLRLINQGNVTTVDNSKQWTDVSGWSYVGQNYYAYAVGDNELYSVEGNTLTQIGGLKAIKVYGGGYDCGFAVCEK